MSTDSKGFVSYRCTCSADAVFATEAELLEHAQAKHGITGINPPAQTSSMCAARDCYNPHELGEAWCHEHLHLGEKYR